jgi:hypothetical protein
MHSKRVLPVILGHSLYFVLASISSCIARKMKDTRYEIQYEVDTAYSTYIQTVVEVFIMSGAHNLLT